MKQFARNYISFGVPISISAESALLLANMHQCVPFGAEVCDEPNERAKCFVLAYEGGESLYRLLIDNRIVAEDLVLQPVLNQLTRELIVYVADCAAECVFVHAGVVGWKRRAIILPGRSFAGKTTLVAELVRAGAIYYSDEYAVLDADGRVHPYARDLQMREVGAVNQRSLPVAHLDGKVGVEELVVSDVVFTEYDEGGCWAPEQVSSGLAVLEMMRHAIPVRRTPDRVMATLARVMDTANAVRSKRGEASEAARRLLAAVGTSI